MATNKRVIKLDIKNKLIILDNGWEISFERCLIATGGRPTTIDMLEKPELKDKVTFFRNVILLKIL